MNKKIKSKKGILRNALVFLFSVVFTVSAYAAPVYDTRVAAEVIEQDTIAPTNEMLNGNAWYAINVSSNIKGVMLTFQNNLLSIYSIDEYGNGSSIMGQYQLDGHRMDLTYMAYRDDYSDLVVCGPVYKTHYIGFTGDGSCIFSMDGINYFSLEQLPNE